MHLPDIDPHIRGVLSPLFDATYYLATNPDVAAVGLDPLLHFFYTGWREGRNPSKSFDCDFYLNRYDDVANAGINPLLHYAWAGKQEGRQPTRVLHYERRILETFEPLDQRAAAWAGAADNSAPRPVHELLIALRKNQAKARVLSISHDDYLTSVGGVQNVMRDELEAFEDAGWSYIHLTAAAPLPMLAPPENPNLFPVKIRIGREPFGVVTASTLAAAIEELGAEGAQFRTIVHHFMGFNIEAATLIVAAASGEPPYFWTHDFFAHCPSYTLMRNDLIFCGAPPPSSPSCLVCGYGTDRQNHMARVFAFFERFSPHVLAPSSGALEQWMRAKTLPTTSLEIVPLALLQELNPTGETFRRSSQPVRVAHLGGRHRIKGWHRFEHLAQSLRDDSRYEFFQFGAASGDTPTANVKHVLVHVTKENPNAMISALEQHQIDIAVIFPLCRETFGFTTYEALAAGTFVITGPDTGNVWPTITANAPHRGAIFPTMSDAQNSFASGAILETISCARPFKAKVHRQSGAANMILKSTNLRGLAS